VLRPKADMQEILILSFIGGPGPIQPGHPPLMLRLALYCVDIISITCKLWT
jgi:hypothetical protein